MNTEAGGLCDSVDIGAEEEKFPVVFFLLALDHAAHFFEAVRAAGIFHAVGCDDKDGLLRDILIPGVFVYIPDVVDRTADCVQEGGAAADVVLTICHGFYFLESHPVVDDFLPVVKEDG